MHSFLTRRCLALLGAFSLLLAVRAAGAEKIKLATLAPTGSTYHKSLLTLRESWKKSSNGGLDLVIYADGKLGGETDTVGLMGVNSVQAAMLTGVGLAEIEAGVAALQSLPMGFRDFDEVDHVGEKMHPMLEERLLKKGYQVLFWADAGWVRFFAKKPVAVPDDLKKLKLFTWAGNPAQVEIYTAAGMKPVALETADIVPGLQTGLIEAVPVPPIFALRTQIDGRAPHMLELNWAPLIGACVIRRETWEKIPADQRKSLLEAARTAGAEIQTNGRKESEEAVKAMEQRGLKVTKVTPDIEAAWRKAAEDAWPKIRGTMVPADVFDDAIKLIREYRASKTK